MDENEKTVGGVPIMKTVEKPDETTEDECLCNCCICGPESMDPLFYTIIDFEEDRDEFDWALMNASFVFTYYHMINMAKDFKLISEEADDEDSDPFALSTQSTCYRQTVSYFGYEEINKLLNASIGRELEENQIEFLQGLARFAKMRIPKKSLSCITLVVLHSDKQLAPHERMRQIRQTLLT